MTQLGTILGTAPYMSPEQWKAEAIDQRSDIWAFGCLLFEMLSGKRPFKGVTSAELAAAILEREPDWNELPETVPIPLVQLTRKSLSKDPEDRQQKASQILDQLAVPLSDEQHLGGPKAPPHGSKTIETSTPSPEVRNRSWALPTGVLATVLLGLLFWGFRPEASDPSPSSRVGPDKLVVLPFSNLNDSPDQQYFCDGLAVELAAYLGQLFPDRLRLIARTSALQYRNTDKPIDQIGRELGVDYVLEGTVQRHGEQVQVHAQLVQTADQVQLWGTTYENQMGDLYSLQSEIAGRIAGSLAIEFDRVQGRAADSETSVLPEAYDAYLKARYSGNALSVGNLERQARIYRQAIELDPDFAKAYLGLAVVYHLQASGGFVPDKIAYPRSETAARQALDLEPDLAAANASLGFIASQYHWDWEKAEELFQKAVAGSDSGAHHLYALFLHAMGRHEEALREITATLELDPLSFLARYNHGRMLLYSGRPEQALQAFNSMRELIPDSLFMGGLAEVYWATGRFDEAVALLEDLMQPTGEATVVALRLSLAYALADRSGDARNVLSRLEKRGYIPAVQEAAVHGVLGDLDRAFVLLEHAYENRDDDLVTINVDPWFDPLRSDPRFQDLLERMNFPDL